MQSEPLKPRGYLMALVRLCREDSTINETRLGEVAGG